MKTKQIILCLLVIGLVFVSGCVSQTDQQDNQTDNKTDFETSIDLSKPHCGDGICQPEIGEDCNNCADCECGDGAYCAIELGKYICKPYKPHPNFRLWIGSQSGIPFQNINLKAGDVAVFYLWIENLGNFELTCTGKEYYDSDLKKEFDWHIDGIRNSRGTQKKSMAFSVEVPNSPGGIDARYVVSCSNFGEDRSLNKTASVILNFS